MRRHARGASLALLALALLASAATGQVVEGSSYPFEIVAQDVIWGHLLEGNFREVGSVAFDPLHQELFVADTKNALIGIYDAEGIPLFAFGGPATLADPSGITVDRAGRIHVLDRVAGHIKSFNYRGKPLEPVTFPAPDTEPPLGRMSCFARGPDEAWYVADAERPRILVYGPELDFRFVLPRPDDVGEFEMVTDISVSADGLIAVTDFRATPVQVFDSRGHFVSGFGNRDIGLDSFSAPQAVAFDESGYLYVVDLLRHDVKVFDAQGEFQAVFGGWFSPESRGRGPGEMLYPTDIAIAPGGLVYVAERYGNRVQLFDRRARASRPPPTRSEPPIRGPIRRQK